MSVKEAMLSIEIRPLFAELDVGLCLSFAMSTDSIA